MEENKNVNIEESVEVEVTEIPQEPSKKEKAWGAAKKVGGYIWSAIKTATSVVGGIVIVALAAGTAIGASKKDSFSEVPVEPVEPDETEGLNNENSNDPTNINVGLDV